MSDVRNRAAVLGKPIAHSLSPVLHNAAYRAMGLQDWDYGRFEFDEHGLGEFVDSRDATWRGLSLTMPLKKKALDFGRPADDFSKILNVANTLVFKKPGSHEYEDIAVYNTDVCGIQGAPDIPVMSSTSNGTFSAVSVVSVIVPPPRESRSTLQSTHCALRTRAPLADLFPSCTRPAELLATRA